MKYANDTTISGSTINNNQSLYQDEINNLAEWCTKNDLLLSVSKTKGLIIDFWKKEANVCFFICFMAAILKILQNFSLFLL